MSTSKAKLYKAVCKELHWVSIFSNSGRLSPDSQTENAGIEESSDALST